MQPAPELSATAMEVDESPESHYTRSRNPNAPPSMPSPIPERTTGSTSAPAKPFLGQYYARANSLAEDNDDYPPSPPQSLPLPSFVRDDPPSDDPDSSSSSDSDGNDKPPRAPRFDSKGLQRPTPSYYYDQDYDPASTGARKRRRRGGAKGIPVFEPTMEDFEGNGGFYGYIKRIEKYGMRSGVVKVVPPKAWTESLPSTAQPLRAMRLREPIEQHLLGSQGLFRVTNVAKSRIWNPAQWKEAAVSEKCQAPDFLGERKKGDRSERSTKKAPVVKKKRAASVSVPESGKEEEGMEADIEDEGNVEEDVQKSPVGNLPSPPITDHDSHGSPPSEAAAPAVPPAEKGAPSADATSSTAPPPVPSTSTLPAPPHVAESPAAETAAKPSPSKRKKRPTNLQRAEPTDAEWDAFIEHFEELPHGMKKEDYTLELMREVERRYWRTLTFGEPPMYGADMAGSIFNDSTKAWNVAHLGDLLPRLAPPACRIPGVVSPYLYFGMWRATFAWHVEDADLYSINYIHFGAPKFWYAVPQEQSDRFERVMAGFFPTDRTKCSEFLRHKAFLASPRVLANSGITLNRVVQLPGEFILTYPKGYHSGFNLGFNAAESINFATERWLPLGRTAKACTCIGDSVNIDVDVWLREASLAENVIQKDFVNQLVRPRKRPSPTKPNELLAMPSFKKKKLEVAPPVPAPVMSRSASVQSKASEAWVCALCPEMSTEGLVRIGEPGVKSKKLLRAHRVCVMFTPATWIDDDPASHVEIVRGFGKIEKARWKLNCQLCKEKHGTKVQCTKGKCSKAFHVTCAMKEDSGIFLDARVPGDASLLDQAKKEIDLAKTGSPVLASKVLIPHRSVGDAPSTAAITQPATTSAPSTIPASSLATPAPSTTLTSAVPSSSSQAAPPPAPPAESPDDGGIKLTILCRVHNPEYQKLEAARKTAELKARVDALAPSSRIRVRTSGGVFEVSVQSSAPAKEAVQVIFDDGKRSDVKWKNIVWPDSPEVARRKQEESERASKSDYVYENRPIQPTKRSAYAPSVVSPYAHPSTQLHGAFPPNGYAHPPPGSAYPPPPPTSTGGIPSYYPPRPYAAATPAQYPYASRPSAPQQYQQRPPQYSNGPYSNSPYSQGSQPHHNSHAPPHPVPHWQPYAPPQAYAGYHNYPQAHPVLSYPSAPLARPYPPPPTPADRGVPSFARLLDRDGGPPPDPSSNAHAFSNSNTVPGAPHRAA